MPYRLEHLETAYAEYRINGTSYGDLWFGEGENDLYRGLGGNDFINGQWGNDRLYGGRGNDVIQGDKGEDRLFGEAGKDSLNGHSGDDFLKGGGGRDQFNFGWDSLGQRDVIADFQTHGKDRDLVLFASFHVIDGLEDITENMTQQGGNVKFQNGPDNVIIFKNMKIADFIEQNFEY